MRMIFKLVLFSIISLTSSYTPSREVKAGHNIPHLSKSLQESSKSFQISGSYFLSLIPLPAIILIIGVLSLLIYLLCLLFRCCCRCCRHDPNLTDTSNYSDEQYRLFVIKVIKKRKFLIALFIMAFLFVVVPIHIMYLGNSQLNKGVQKTSDALLQLSDIFSTIATSSKGVLDNTITIDDAIQNSCPQYTSYASKSVSSLETASNDIYNAVNQVAKDIKNSRKYLIQYGINSKNLVVYIFYAVIVFVAFIFLAGVCLKSKLLSFIGIPIAWIIVLALTFVCCVEMIFVTLLGDICINPTQNLLDIIPAGTARKTLAYYTECVGTNPLQYDINNSTAYSSQLNSTVNMLINQGGCTSLKSVYGDVSSLLNDVQTIVDQTNCTPLYNVWNTLINQGFCNYLYKGLFTTWIVQFLTSGGLFFMICVIVVLTNYYPPAIWNAKVDDVRSSAYGEVPPMDGVIQASAPADIVVVDSHTGGDVEMFMKTYVPVQTKQL